MTDERLFSCANRKIIVCGHYGSGKTEVAVSLALYMAKKTNSRVSIVDLDIVNPYFRSRERKELLSGAGICVYGSVYDNEITAELPALGANAKAPLEDENCRVIIDVGGNDAGARVLNQFTKYFTDAQTAVLAVINKNRPETNTVQGALSHIHLIEAATGIAVSGIVNNTHMLRHTTADTIIGGYELCRQICEESKKEFWFNCYLENLIEPEALFMLPGFLLPIGAYIRPSWLDL